MENKSTNVETSTTAPTDSNNVLVAGLRVGEIIVADIIGEGFYEIHSFGKCYVNVKCLKLFGKGFQDRGHITNCHNTPEPINMERWMSYRRVSKPCH